MKKVTDIVWELAEPVVKENGCELWDVEYVREAGQWYLRLYLDKEGGVDILDCEAVSRRVSDLLDEVDPIESSYMFEVSSAGAERQLKRPSDFQRFMGEPVLVKTYKNRDGRRSSPGSWRATRTARCCWIWAAQSRYGLKRPRWRWCACVWNFKYTSFGLDRRS